MKKIFGVYSKNQLKAGILRAGLVLVYAVLIICTAWLLKEYSAGYIIGRIIPYGIPPLLSLLSAIFLSLFVLSLEQTRTESFLFAAICMVFGILNLDIFLLGIISDPQIALVISRIGGDEFAVLLPSINSREAQHVLTRIRQKEKELVLVCMQKDQGEKEIPIKISIGLAGSDETQPEKVIKLADERMYIDKEKFYRQNQVGSYSEIS